MKKIMLMMGALAFAPLATASPYVSANFGEATYEIDCAAPLTCDEKDKSYKIGLGWQFNRYLAAEAAYNDLGQADLEATGFGAFLHASAYELSGVGTYPLGNTIFSALGRLGLAYSKSKYGRDLAGERASTGLTYGAGLQLDFSKNVAVRLQWQRFNVKAQIEGEVEEKGDVDMVSFGILLRAR